MPLVSAAYGRALVWAEELHRNQRRKGKPVPYISHLIAVSALVWEDGGTEDQAIAGLLHDDIEDAGQSHASIAERFGQPVADIVRDCTDTDEGRTGAPKEPWLLRKTRYVASLEHKPTTSLLVAVAATGSTTMQPPPWLAARPTLRLWLVRLGLSLLALTALTAIGKGLILGWRLSDTDLYERLDEWRLFRVGIFPSDQLATPTQRLQPHFRTTVYLPWALPLFGLLFARGGAWQGTLLIQGLSLVSLALISAFGWRNLRGSGAAAGWLGALAPLAIAANSNALAQGQFSIVCMGLITGQWLLLARGRPLPAGLCWALAMIKPQIAAAFALPFLRRGRRAGLAAGLAVLAALTAGALAHTHTAPLAYLGSWFKVLPRFLGATNSNAAAGLAGFLGGPAALALLLVGGLALAALGARASGEIEQRLPPKEPSRTPPKGPPERTAEAVVQRKSERDREQQALQLNSLCAVAGAVALYHGNYDNIMLFPVLLAVLRLALVTPTLGSVSLAFLLAASLWTPQRILDGVPGSDLVQAVIWSVAGLVLLARLLKRGGTAALREPLNQSAESQLNLSQSRQ